MLDGWESAAATKITDNGHSETTLRDVRRVSRRFSREPVVYTGLRIRGAVLPPSRVRVPVPAAWSTFGSVSPSARWPRSRASATRATRPCARPSCPNAWSRSRASATWPTVRAAKSASAAWTTCTANAARAWVSRFRSTPLPHTQVPVSTIGPGPFHFPTSLPSVLAIHVRPVVYGLPASTTPFVVYDPDVCFCRRRNGVQPPTPDNNVRRSRKVNFEDKSRRFSHLRRCRVESFICHVARYYGHSFRTVVTLYVVTIYRSRFISTHLVLGHTICEYASMRPRVRVILQANLNFRKQKSS